MGKDQSLLRIFQAVPIAVVIASPLSGRILWVNQRLVEMYGADGPSALIGLTLFDFIEPSQLGKAVADLAKVAAGMSPPPVTYQLKRANGERAAGQVASVPLMFQGQPAMLSFVADVSEREQLLRSLSESEERYRQLLDSMPGGVVVVDGDHILYANGSFARAVGFETAADVIDKRISRFIGDEQRIAFREARELLLISGGRAPDLQLLLVPSRGEPFEVTASSTLVHWDGRLATQTLLTGAWRLGDSGRGLPEIESDP